MQRSIHCAMKMLAKFQSFLFYFGLEILIYNLFQSIKLLQLIHIIKEEMHQMINFKLSKERKVLSLPKAFGNRIPIHKVEQKMKSEKSETHSSILRIDSKEKYLYQNQLERIHLNSQKGVISIHKLLLMPMKNDQNKKKLCLETRPKSKTISSQLEHESQLPIPTHQFVIQNANSKQKSMNFPNKTIQKTNLFLKKDKQNVLPLKISASKKSLQEKHVQLPSLNEIEQFKKQFSENSQLRLENKKITESFMNLERLIAQQKIKDSFYEQEYNRKKRKPKDQQCQTQEIWDERIQNMFTEMTTQEHNDYFFNIAQKFERLKQEMTNLEQIHSQKIKSIYEVQELLQQKKKQIEKSKEEIKKMEYQLLKCREEEKVLDTKMNEMEGYVYMQQNRILEIEVKENKIREQELLEYACEMQIRCQDMIINKCEVELSAIKREYDRRLLAIANEIFNPPKISVEERKELFHKYVTDIHRYYITETKTMNREIECKANIIKRFVYMLQRWASVIHPKRKYIQRVKKQFILIDAQIASIIDSCQNESISSESYSISGENFIKIKELLEKLKINNLNVSVYG